MSVDQHATGEHAPSHEGGGTRRLAGIALGFLRAHVIALAVIAGLVALYALVGFFLVPRLARSQIEDYVSNTLHGRIELGQLRFNPFALDTSIAGLKLTDADGAPLVSFRHLYVNAELASLWQRAVVLEEVALTAPDVQLVIARDGSVNLAKLVPESTESAAAEPSAPPPVRIGRLSIRQGRVGLEDHTVAEPFVTAVSPITFTLHDFKTDVGYRNAYQFAGTTASGEQLEWAGGFTVQPLGSTGQFRMQGLKLATIDSYIYESLPFKLASGNVLLRGSYVFQLEPFTLDVTIPTLAVRNMTLTERKLGARAPVTLPEIDVEQLSFSMGKRDIGLRRVDIRDARIEVAREEDGTISLERLLGTQAQSQDDASADGPTAGRSAAKGTTASTAESSAGEPARESAARSAPTSAAAKSASKSASPKSDWNVHVDTIHVENAAVGAEDRAIAPAVRFELAPLGVTIDGWRTDPSAKFKVDADVTINEEGRLLSKGEVQLEPLNTSLAVELTDFGLPVLQPYLEQTTAVTLHSGKLNAKGNLLYTGTPEDAPPLKFAGEVQLADLRTTDQFVNQDFIKWRSLALSGIDFELNPDRLTIDRAVARQPYASVIIAKDRTLNVVRVLNPGAPIEAAKESQSTEESDDGQTADSSAEQQHDTPSSDGPANEQQSAPSAVASAKEHQSEPPAEVPAQQTPSGEPSTRTAGAGKAAGNGKTFPVSIRTVQFIDGTAHFADYSIEPSFAAGILELNGKVTGLSSEPDSRAQVALAGKVDKYAPVDINGEVNLLAATAYTAIDMNFRNMELTTFNPYSGKFAGYNISRGKLNTELKYRVENRKLQAEHHIVLDNLEFGAKTDSKDAAPIPIKLAVALLKDRQGIIDINLPVSGTLDDPKFRLGPIIWKAILGLLTKIVTAPFAALGALFGGGEELAFVDFSVGSAELATTETDKLNKLSKALVERPQVKLNVPLTVTTEQDSEAMAKAALAAKLPEGMLEADDKGANRKRLKALEAVYQSIANAPPEFPPETIVDKKPDVDAQAAWLQQTLLDKLKPDQGALDALAQQRARAVQGALLSNTALSPERVFLAAERGENKMEGGKVRMEMKLE